MSLGVHKQKGLTPCPPLSQSRRAPVGMLSLTICHPENEIAGPFGAALKFVFRIRAIRWPVPDPPGGSGTGFPLDLLPVESGKGSCTSITMSSEFGIGSLARVWTA